MSSSCTGCAGLAGAIGVRAAVGALGGWEFCGVEPWGFCPRRHVVSSGIAKYFMVAIRFLSSLFGRDWIKLPHAQVPGPDALSFIPESSQILLQGRCQPLRSPGPRPQVARCKQVAHITWECLHCDAGCSRASVPVKSGRTIPRSAPTLPTDESLCIAPSCARSETTGVQSRRSQPRPVTHDKTLMALPLAGTRTTT